MRIILQFEDYYDYCSYICAEDIVYSRVVNPEPDYTNLRKLLDDRSISRKVYWSDDKVEYESRFYYIIIGDIVIPMYKEHTNVPKKLKTETYSEYEERCIKEVIYSYCYKLEDVKNLGFGRVAKFFKDSNHHRQVMAYIRSVTQEPIVIVSDYTVTINGPLKPLKLRNHMNETQIIQELLMFINKKNSVEKEVEFSDLEKIKSHGFDTKQSFRKRK